MEHDRHDRSTILCVESARAAPALSEQCLAPASYELVRLDDPVDAAREARRRVFDAYLVESDDDDGVAPRFARIVRRVDPNAPIFIYSAAPSTALALAARAAGVTRVIDAAATSLVEIADIVARGIATTELRNLAAVSAEIVALAEYVSERGEALADRAHALAQLAPGERERARRAQRAYLETMARAKFLSAGGTRAAFHRAWLAMQAELPANGSRH